MYGRLWLAPAPTSREGSLTHMRASLAPQQPVEPGGGALQLIELESGLGGPMAFAGITDENRFYTTLFQRGVELFRLGDMNVIVRFAVQYQRGRADTLDVLERRPLPEDVV